MNEREIIIEAKLRTDHEFLEMAILKLYEKQTEDEQSFRSTTHTNRVGFTRSDGMFFSEIAEQLQDGHHLDFTEFEHSSKRMIKYTNQLSNYLTDEEIE